MLPLARNPGDVSGFYLHETEDEMFGYQGTDAWVSSLSGLAEAERKKWDAQSRGE